MRGILIDPNEQTIKEVDVAKTSNLEPFYKLMDCRMVQLVTVGPGVQLALDEEYTYSKGDDQRYWSLGGNRFGGKAVLIGDTGRSFKDLPPQIHIREVAPMIVWEDPRLYASGIATSVETSNDGKTFTITQTTQYAIRDDDDESADT
jgi:hypothetical protein